MLLSSMSLNGVKMSEKKAIFYVMHVANFLRQTRHCVLTVLTVQRQRKKSQFRAAFVERFVSDSVA
jgi:hypothetical protein